MVFQSYALFPNMTVADNIGFGMQVQKRPADAIRKRVGELLEMIHMPEKARSLPVPAVGRPAAARRPRPRARRSSRRSSCSTSRCPRSTPRSGSPCASEIRAIQRQLGITTVYVTHDQEEALSLSDRVVVMSEGRIEQIGTPFEIYNFPATAFVASFVGTLNLVAAAIVDAIGRAPVDRRPGGPDREARHGCGRRRPVTLARAPGEHRAGRRPGRLEPDPAAGSRTSASSDRSSASASRSGESSDGGRPPSVLRSTRSTIRT